MWQRMRARAPWKGKGRSSSLLPDFQGGLQFGHGGRGGLEGDTSLDVRGQHLTGQIGAQLDGAARVRWRLHRRCTLVPLTPFLWPALAAATASEMVSLLAKELA